MTLTPIGDNLIVVRRTVKPTGLIEIPEEESLIADVLAIGPKVKEIVPGMAIILQTTAGREVTISANGNSGTFIVVKESLIVALYNNRNR